MTSTLTSHTRLRGAEDVVFTAMEDEAVLLHLGTRKYYGLNVTGMRIWQMVQVGATIADICTALSEEYDVTPTDAEKAVIGLCDELLREKLICITDEPISDDDH